MDYETFTFEKVSITEAIAAKREDETPPRQEIDWERRRQPLLPSEMKLQNETCAWLVALPAHVRPLHLARKFPRIANKLAAEWARPVMCDKTFEELMIDHRGTRQGFPVEIAKEITELRAYYNTEVFVAKRDTWELTL